MYPCEVEWFINEVLEWVEKRYLNICFLSNQYMRRLFASFRHHFFLFMPRNHFFVFFIVRCAILNYFHISPNEKKVRDVNLGSLFLLKQYRSPCLYIFPIPFVQYWLPHYKWCGTAHDAACEYYCLSSTLPHWWQLQMQILFRIWRKMGTINV